MPNSNSPTTSFDLSITGPLGIVTDVGGLRDDLSLLGLGNVVFDSTFGAITRNSDRRRGSYHCALGRRR